MQEEKDGKAGERKYPAGQMEAAAVWQPRQTEENQRRCGTHVSVKYGQGSVAKKLYRAKTHRHPRVTFRWPIGDIWKT